MKILCCSCGHKLDLGDAYDNYEGPVRCWVCHTLLVIKTQEGDVCSMRLASMPEPARVSEPARASIPPEPADVLLDESV